MCSPVDDEVVGSWKAHTATPTLTKEWASVIAVERHTVGDQEGWKAGEPRTKAVGEVSLNPQYGSPPIYV